MSILLNIKDIDRKAFIKLGPIHYRFCYLPVDKNLWVLSPGREVLLFTHKNQIGLFGRGIITTPPIKPSAIKYKPELVINRNFLQIGVAIGDFNYLDSIIPYDILMNSPPLNEGKQPLVIANSRAYWSSWLSYYVDMFHNQHPHVFVYNCPRRLDYEYIWHLSRERCFKGDYRNYWYYLHTSDLTCHYCNINFEKKLGHKEAIRFLELHDATPYTKEKYVKVNTQTQILTCPNCHKLEHEKMRNLSEIFKAYNYGT